MEQSKSISLAIAKLKIAYPYYFNKLTNEEFIGLISMYQEYLSGYSEDTLLKAVKMLIGSKEFMPSIKEIIDACEKESTKQKYWILEKMAKDGYFKSVVEIDKANKYVSDDNIPNWLLKDMQEYALKNGIYITGTSNQIFLGGSHDD